MNSPAHVLDSSALLALIEDEPGAETVDDLVSELDEPTVLQADRFKADYKVSLADAWIAAVARPRDAVLVHKDPELEALEGLVQMKALPYESTPAVTRERP